MNVLENPCTPATIERGNREKFVCEAQKVIYFKFCESEKDIHFEDTEENTFQPEFTHQVQLIDHRVP